MTLSLLSVDIELVKQTSSIKTQSYWGLELRLELQGPIISVDHGLVRIKVVSLSTSAEMIISCIDFAKFVFFSFSALNQD